MSNEMTVRDQRTDAALWAPDDADLRGAVRNSVFPDANDAEMALYFHDCRRSNVHPLDRLIHPQVRTDKRGVRRYTAVTSIDLFRSRAGDTGEHAGTDDAVFVVGDDGKPILASVTVYRMVDGVRCPFTAAARWSEYYPEGFAGMWNKMGFTMLAKCAEALALRKAFPRQLVGLYTGDEMDQASNDERQSAKPRPTALATAKREAVEASVADVVETMTGGGTEPAATDGAPEWGLADLMSRLEALRFAAERSGEARVFFKTAGNSDPVVVDADILRACGRVDATGTPQSMSVTAVHAKREEAYRGGPSMWTRLCSAVDAECQKAGVAS